MEIELLPEPVENVASTSSPWLAGVSAAAPSLVSLAGSLGKSSAPPPPMNYSSFGNSNAWSGGGGGGTPFGMGIGLDFKY